MSKEIFKRYKRLKQEIRYQRERLAALEMILASPKIPKYGDGRHATGYIRDIIGEQMIKKAELEKEIELNLEKLEKEAVFIEKSIQDIKHPAEREILRMRYIEGKTWEYIGEYMMYNERQCRRIHDRVMKNFTNESACEKKGMGRCR